MAVKFIALDIDGTLVNEKKQLTAKTYEAIHRAAEKGIVIAIASGRPLKGILPVAKVLDLDKIGGYILSFNGGRILEYPSMKVIRNITLKPEYIPEIYELSVSNKVNIMSYEGDIVISENVQDKYLILEAGLNGLETKQIDNFVKHIDFPINKCLMLGEGNYLAEVEKVVHNKLSDRMDVYRSEPYFLEVLPKGIDKAKSLEELIQKLGIDRSELMTFGDGYNDKTMIEYAGIGVAMANARPEVRECADFVTLSNEEDGVAFAIEKYIFN